MNAIKPLIQKNLILIKRNPIKSFFQLFYPVIILLLMISFMKEENLTEIQEFSYNFFEKVIDFNKEQVLLPKNNLRVFISNNESLTKSFKNFIGNDNSSYIFFENTNEFKNSLEKSFFKYSAIILPFIEKDNGISFMIRVNETDYKFKSVWDNVNPFNIYPEPESFLSNQHIFDIQIFLSKFILYLEKATFPDLIINLRPMKTPSLKFNLGFQQFFNMILPFFLSVSYISILFKFVLWMVNEKEKKLKDLLFRQGISNLEYFLSWFFTLLVLVFIPLLINAYLMKIYILKKTSILITLLLLFLYNSNILTMAFFFQNFCHDIKSSQTMLKIFYVGISFLSVPLASESTPLAVKYIFAVFPQVLLKYAFEILLQAEVMPNGLDFNLMSLSYKDFSFFSIIFMFVFDFFLYFTISYLIQNYEYFSFDFKKYLRIFNRNNEETAKFEMVSKAETKFDNLLNIDTLVNHENIQSTFEEVPESLLFQDQTNENLKICSITKSFDTLKAVNEVSLDLYKHQIFVLLGHNGAGKSTLINIINGSLSADSGQILFENSNLLENKDILFQNIGFCSQENIFFDELTVYENLKILQKIKSGKVNKIEIEELLRELSLTEKKNSLAETLSGGQKRKLCIGLAMIGNSKLILLDEPTSGMDVTAKRSLWGFLKEHKKNKIIILTTHSLDEADYLADRIGIISEGKIICCGTSSFLKNNFSCGFSLTLLFEENFEEKNRGKIVEKLREIDSKLLVKLMSKESVIVNFPQINEEMCENLFQFIENNKKQFGIDHYTLSSTTLEDVFLKVNNNEFSKKLFESSSRNETAISFSDENIHIPKNNNSKEFIMNLKRYALTNIRNKKNILLEISSLILTFFISLLTLNAFLNTNKIINYANLAVRSEIQLAINSKNYNLSDFQVPYPGKVFKFKEIQGEGFRTSSDLDNFVYKSNIYHNNKAVISLNSKGNNKYEAIILYHSGSIDFGIIANNILISTIMKKELNIKTNIITSLETEFEYKKLIPKGVDIDINSMFVLYFCFLILSGFINLSGYMVTLPLKERINNVKHLLYLNGMNSRNYWFSMLLNDLLKYVFFSIIIYPYLLQFRYELFISILPVLVTYAISLTLFAYCFSFLFQSEENGQKFYLVASYMIMFLVPIIVSLTFDTADFTNYFDFNMNDLFPQSSIIFSLINIGVAVMFQDLKNKKLTTIKITKSDAIFYAVLKNLIQICIFSFVLYLLDKKFFERIFQKFLNFVKIDKLERENKYTRLEKEKTDSTLSEYPTILKNCNKIYNPFCGQKVHAVNNFNLALAKNEKFGLLGFNGSGKSTTFKALTNEILLNEGNIKVLKYDLNQDFEKIRNIVGYCPQATALFDFLTVEETLDFFLKIRARNVDMDKILVEYGLIQFRSTYCMNLSGGNQRKLNFAIALMNNPSLVLLDEPSTGVDPESRRIMWKHMNDIQEYNSNFNLILSTHSLEEAEILCDRVGWMKSGNFICTGNPEKLKREFSEGYIVQIKLRKSNDEELNNSRDKQLKFVGNFVFDEVFDEVNTQNLNYIYYLDDVCEKFQDFVNSINFIKRYENQFDILLTLKESKQGGLFIQLLKLKNLSPNVLEINIQLQSLENIFESLDNSS